MTATNAPIPRLALVHIVIFSLGATTSLLGILTGSAAWFVVGGPCLILSGVLTWVGSRITFAGLTGELLRMVLGPAQVRRINLRAIVWVLAGLLVCLWAFEGMSSKREGTRSLPERSELNTRVMRAQLASA